MDTHQLIVALGYWFMVWPAWNVHKWTGRYGVLTFLATLAIVDHRRQRAPAPVVHRAHLSRGAGSQLANVRRLVRAADVAFSLIMIATGLVIADAYTGWGALFVSFGLGGALAFLVIEPATARRPSRTQSESRNPRAEIEMAVWDAETDAAIGSAGVAAHRAHAALERRLAGARRHVAVQIRDRGCWEADVMISRSAMQGTRWLTLRMRMTPAVRNAWESAGHFGARPRVTGRLRTI